jgi:hypothetical protein
MQTDDSTCKRLCPKKLLLHHDWSQGDFAAGDRPQGLTSTSLSASSASLLHAASSSHILPPVAAVSKLSNQVDGSFMETRVMETGL